MFAGRFIAVAALVLHSIFGCALHHAGAECSHQHPIGHPTGHHEDHQAVATDEGTSHRGGAPEHHSQIRCNFITSARFHPAFVEDLAAAAPLGDWISADRCGRAMLVAPNEPRLARFTDSLARCALLCIWRI